VHANTIIGFPGETVETVNETIDLIETAQPDFYRAQLWYCDPTTPVWQRRESLGIKGNGFNWSHRTMDATTAADLVECCFLKINGSQWLPQYGFEPWSLYYLQRRGMALADIRRFITAFNAAVAAKLIDPEREEIAPDDLAAIRAACNPKSSNVPIRLGGSP
jgi:hypothetical protein